ncbi:acetylornithine deacetylase [Glaciimonas sp. PAMC28666]|uniref:acetylornithine deacetylase n=1 Tax=Glaciimonas sp. PAMC28666 TaxID=2807626 RepID=UPI001966329A|nr:acetylornithine deacetylase [Glaciimonas sp. PAMC28666]QRX81761.1 acetylornithine deacetylase [Glaciimonas sp. PAMC28666]
MKTVLQPQQTTIDCLKQLISFDTTSRNSNLALIDWTKSYLENLGASIRLDFNKERNKANLIATFGEGPGGIVLSGHTDVVPVDGQLWSSDPFCAEIRGEKLYGRGSVDMKGFISVVLGSARMMATSSLKTPIHIALTYDEEAGCLGIPGLLKDLATAGIKPTGCIVGEPTEMKMVAAHKGGRIYRCQVHGKSAHSSLTPHGVNAIEYAARIITFIQDLAWREEEHGLKIDGFDVPFSTLSTNIISGGSGKNIIPADCEFFFEYRYLPGVQAGSFMESIGRYVAEQVEPRMKKNDPEAHVSFECVGEIPALEAKENEEIFQLVQSLLRPHQPGKVAYGTEASFFQEVGVPSVVCGPGRINEAHKPDEFVSLEQLYQCERFIQNLILKMGN